MINSTKQMNNQQNIVHCPFSVSKIQSYEENIDIRNHYWLNDGFRLSLYGYIPHNMINSTKQMNVLLQLRLWTLFILKKHFNEENSPGRTTFRLNTLLRLYYNPYNEPKLVPLYQIPPKYVFNHPITSTIDNKGGANYYLNV